MSDWSNTIERMQADGRITTHDADEVRNFASYLAETAGIPTNPAKRSAKQQERWLEIYAGHYPEDFERTDPALYAVTMDRIRAKVVSIDPFGLAGNA